MRKKNIRSLFTFSGSVITSIFFQVIIKDFLSLRKARALIAQDLGLSGYEGK